MNRRNQMTRLLLYESLVELMRERDVGQISVSALCRQAGLNRSTFYKYYQTPADVLEDMTGAEIQSIVREAEDRRPQPSTADAEREKVTQMLGSVLARREACLAINDGQQRKLEEGRYIPDRDDYIMNTVTRGVPAAWLPCAYRIILETIAWWLRSETPQEPAELAAVLLGMRKAFGGE